MELGEDRHTSQQWDNGSPPSIRPDPVILGDIECITEGEKILPSPVLSLAFSEAEGPVIITGDFPHLRIDFTPTERPEHGLALGGDIEFVEALPVLDGGLALGGDIEQVIIIPEIDGGLALGGDIEQVIIIPEIDGGLALGGDIEEVIIIPEIDGGLALGGDIEEVIVIPEIDGGLALGGDIEFVPPPPVELEGGLALGGDIEDTSPPTGIPPSWEWVVDGGPPETYWQSHGAIFADVTGGRWRMHVKSPNDATGMYTAWLDWDCTAQDAADALNAIVTPDAAAFWAIDPLVTLGFQLNIFSNWTTTAYDAGDVYFVDSISSELT